MKQHGHLPHGGMKKGSEWSRCRGKPGEAEAQRTPRWCGEWTGEARWRQGEQRLVVIIMGQEGAPNHSDWGLGRARLDDQSETGVRKSVVMKSIWLFSLGSFVGDMAIHSE